MPHVNALIRGITRFLDLMEKVQTCDSYICAGLDLIWSTKITAVKRE